MAPIVYLLFLALVAVQQLAHTAQVLVSPSQETDTQKTADLTRLINETLSINNKTLLKPEAAAFKDDWTFERVEYDLMEFLQDLGARYQSNDKKPTADGADEIEARKETQANSSSSQTTAAKKETGETKLETFTASIATTTEISTSLASGDHDIAESKWQYGIFDRFTRARASSTTPRPTKDPYEDLETHLDVRSFNSDECGLRTYSNLEEIHAKVDANEQTGEASKDLNQRRQRPNLDNLLAHKKYQFQAADFMPERPMPDIPQESSVVKNWANKMEKEAYDSFKQQSKVVGDMPSLLDRVPNLGSDTSSGGSGSNVGGSATGDSEFNLASRRHWLQQQLGNTLQMLGFNGSAQSVAEFLNQTSGLSINNRENMMKKSAQLTQNKLGKSLFQQQHDPLTSASASASVQQQQHQQQHQLSGTPSEQQQAIGLSARQDELKLEARVIGGSDARLGDSPWSVSLQALVSRPGTSGVEYRHYCGGTIISEYYVLTAAHCLDFMVGRESRLFVVIGDLNWRMSSVSVYGRRFGIDKLIIHSGYKSTAFGHDIGLIRTKESMKPLRSNGRYIVNSVCLPEKGVEHSGEAELVGWGLFSNRNEMADSLQIADVPILPRPLCVDLYKRRTGLIQWLIGIELITDKQICAGTFGRGICQGDSGSALVFNQKVATTTTTSSMIRSKRGISINKQQQQQQQQQPSATIDKSLHHDLSASHPIMDQDHSSANSNAADDLSNNADATHHHHQHHHDASAGGFTSIQRNSDDPRKQQQQQQQQQHHQGDGIVGKGILRGYEHREQLQSKATIIGIVAFGGIRRCSYQSLPGVYMQTSKYMDWILPRIQS